MLVQVCPQVTLVRSGGVLPQRFRKFIWRPPNHRGPVCRGCGPGRGAGALGPLHPKFSDTWALPPALKSQASVGKLGGSDGKESAAMWETLVQSLGWEYPLEKGMAAHSTVLAWRILEQEPGGLQSMGSQRVGHD